MTKHKAIALTLVLVLALLSPASALAKPEGTDRNVKGTSSGTLRIDPATGAFTGETEGFAKHLGKVTSHLKGTGALTPEGSFAGSGTAKIVAANGDRLRGTFTLSTTKSFPDGSHESKVVITITGGEGRFADASGRLTVICLVGPPSQEGEVLVSTLDCKLTGHISY